MNLLSREEVYLLDQSLLKSRTDLFSLIQEVGQALSLWFLRNYSKKQSVLIAVGSGHNGDDGLSLGVELIKRGYSVFFYNASSLLTSSSSDVRKKLLSSISEETWVQTLGESEFDVVVDALYGVGLNRELGAEDQKCIVALNQMAGEKVSLDLPSGVDANSGQLWATSCFEAHTNLSIGFHKRGLFLLPAALQSQNNIAIEVKSLNSVTLPFVPQCCELPAFEDWFRLFPRARTDNKYTRGKVTILQSPMCPGAAVLTACAALHCGAGYVQIFCPEDFWVQGSLTHPQFVWTGYQNATHLARLILNEHKSQSFVWGPGWTDSSLNLGEIMKQPTAFVFDAGVLTSALVSALHHNKRSQDVLTPHEGELHKILPKDSNWSRWQSLSWLQENIDSTLLLKGADTLIGSKGQPTRLATWNSSQLAFAGSGDILCGIIAAFIAQGKPTFEATLMASDLHRKAGALYPFATTPEKLIEGLHRILNQLSVNSANSL